jgi:hypothetical protein
VLLAQLFPQFNVLFGEHKNKLHCGVNGIETLKGHHNQRFAAKQLKLLWHLTTHTDSLTARNNYKVSFHKFIS